MSEADLTAYIDDKANYGDYFWKDSGNPSSSWAVPFVTGHKYKIHWQEGLDFEFMKYEVSERWEKTDLDIHFMHNFTDVREAVYFNLEADPDQRMDNETYNPDYPMNNG